MPKTTYTQVIDNLAYYPITVQSSCKEVKCRENASGATNGLLLKAPLTTSPVITYGPGDQIKFNNSRGYYRVGQILGYVQTDTGSITLEQEED